MKHHTNTCPVPNGILLVIGGSEDKIDDDRGSSEHHPLEILKAFIELTGKANPSIEVITTASSEGDEQFGEYQETFNKLGVTGLGHIHHERRADVLQDDLDERLNKADAVFFSGGDQLKLTSLYGGTKFLLALKHRYIFEGLVLGGTSAGAMAFSTPMIFAGNKKRQQISGEVRITTGLEFLKDVCIDTHFVDRSRFVRMAQVIATNPTSIGIGIEENTAITVRNGCDVHVIGDGVVMIIEGYNITDSNITDILSGRTINIHNLNLKLLGRNCTYRIRLLNPSHL